MMLYRSTRGGERNISASQAILNGLASDGGLYVPECFPELTVPFEKLSEMNYQELAYEIMSLFLTDYSEQELKQCIANAYDSKFDTPEIAPLHKADDAYFLELFHGETIAFKDMALSILPHLMTTAARKNRLDKKIVILTATSGDTGKAAMAGFADVPGTEIIVFYPKDGVSPVQERQMITQKGGNTHVVAIRGNFDDAQTSVKKIFGDAKVNEIVLNNGMQFSSANSINIGRLVPQIVYYVYAYCGLIRRGAVKAGDAVNVVVPTGNFGNILAAYYACRIGLPFAKLLCASNENKVLFDFFATGIYDKNRPFVLTTSPSMDILVSSNLERLLFEAAGCCAEKTAFLMKELSAGGKYTITADMKETLDIFYGNYASESEVMAVIADLADKDDYVIDPHTAVGAAVYRKYKKETGDPLPTVIASTASPYKFARSVLHAVDGEKYDPLTDDEQFEALKDLSGIEIPGAVREFLTSSVRHNPVIDPDEMEETILKILGAGS